MGWGILKLSSGVPWRVVLDGFSCQSLQCRNTWSVLWFIIIQNNLKNTGSGHINIHIDIPIRMDKLWSTDNIKCRQRCEATGALVHCWWEGTLVHCWWECKRIQPVWKTAGKLNIFLHRIQQLCFLVLSKFIEKLCPHKTLNMFIAV